jgi:hypothetical protein
MQLALLMTIVPYKDGAKSQTLLVCPQLPLVVPVLLMASQPLKLILNADMELIASTWNVSFLTLSPMEILEFQLPQDLSNGEALSVNPELLLLEQPTGLALKHQWSKIPPISLRDMPLLLNV